MKILFMGTPEFAVPSLQALIDSEHEVVGVFTNPDKPKGRGYKMAFSPVKELALQHEIPVFQPKTLRKGTAYDDIVACAPDMIVVAAYGKLLPKNVLDYPKYGCVNVHGSLLPKYRGAAPIQWSVLNGDEEAGVTTMYMAEGLDTGDMLEKAATLVGENETSDQLYLRLADIGAELLLSTIKKIEEGTIDPEPQDDALSCYAPMLSKELSPIDFTKSAKEVHNLIRGLSSWPAAHTTYKGKRLKIYESRLAEGKGVPGEIISKKKFIVACGEGAVEFVTVQHEGSKKMAGADFLRGKQPNPGEFLVSE